MRFPEVLLVLFTAWRLYSKETISYFAASIEPDPYGTDVPVHGVAAEVHWTSDVHGDIVDQDEALPGPIHLDLMDVLRRRTR